MNPLTKWRLAMLRQMDAKEYDEVIALIILISVAFLTHKIGFQAI